MSVGIILEMVAVGIVPHTRSYGFSVFEIALKPVFPVCKVAIEVVRDDNTMAVTFALTELTGVGLRHRGAVQSFFAAFSGHTLSMFLVVEPFTIVVGSIASASFRELVVVSLAATHAVFPLAIVLAIIAVQLVIHVSATMRLALGIHVAPIVVAVVEAYLHRIVHQFVLVFFIEFLRPLVA